MSEKVGHVSLHELTLKRATSSCRLMHARML